MSSKAILIQAIQEKQELEGLTLFAMANKLGITPSYLSMVYGGHRGMGKKLLNGIMRCYPELEKKVAVFLLGDITDSQERFTVSGDGSNA